MTLIVMNSNSNKDKSNNISGITLSLMLVMIIMIIIIFAENLTFQFPSNSVSQGYLWICWC